MPELNFTPEQRAAIDTRGSTVLVSAAAGSGKTRVLTERLMAYLTDAENPVDIDRFLVITYTVSYSINYVNNGTTGYRKNITQNIGFNGSVNLTPKMGITFQGGYDIKENKLTTSSVSISRDLHCWQMSFSWIPFGAHRSWSFNIGVKAASLADLKYDKSQSMYDNMY